MTLNDNRLFDVIDISYKIFDIFFEDKELYDYYKKEVLKAIFVSRFKMKYNQIDDELKEKFFRRVQEAFKVYIEKYGLYEDIKENVSETIREFFKFDDIVNEILSSNAKK